MFGDPGQGLGMATALPVACQDKVKQMPQVSKKTENSQRTFNIPLIRKLVFLQNKAFQAYYVIIYFYILYVLCVFTYIHPHIIELLGGLN